MKPHHLDNPVPSDPLYDSNTGLYSFQKFFSRLEEVLVSQRALGLIYIDAQELKKIEYDYGQLIYNEILKLTAHHILEVQQKLLTSESTLATRNINDEVFLLFLTDMHEDYQNFLKSDNLASTIDQFISTLNTKIFQMIYPYTRKVLKVDVGYSYIVFNPLLSLERTVYRLIDSAKNMARFNGEKFFIQIKESLKDIIIEENIRTFYQPIFNLSTLEIVGYEALSRGPENSPIQSPMMLFTIAEKTNLSFELDKLCRKMALENARGISPDKLLFVNTFPSTLHDPEFKGEALNAMLRSLNLNPRKIVFEITEKFAIENYDLFKKDQDHYTKSGFAMAIDDVGSGYGSLEAIANLKPEYLKIDMSIIRDINTNTIKQEILKVIIELARQIKAHIITEGIETKEEFETLRGMGIEFGQGYWLGRPKASLHEEETSQATPSSQQQA